MRIRNAVTAAVLALVAGVAPLQAQQSPEGAWTLVEVWGQTADGEDWRVAENLQPSLFLFHDGHYSMTAVTGTEPRPQLPEDATRSTVTPEQGDALWRFYLSNSGAYEIRDSMLVTWPHVALWPPLMAEGSERAYGMEWDGPDLLLTTRLYGWWRTWRLHRVD